MRFHIAALALGLLMAGPVLAQEAPQPRKLSNVDWFRAQHFEFEEGKRTPALVLLYERFVPAAEAAEVELPLIVEHLTGDWDLSLFFPIESPSILEYEVSPRDLKFRAKLAEREGGPEKAAALFAEFSDMVTRSSTEIVMMRLRDRVSRRSGGP